MKTALWMELVGRSRASLPCHPPPTGSFNSQVRGKSGDRRGSPLTGSYVQPRAPAVLSRGRARGRILSHLSPPLGCTATGGGTPLGGPAPCSISIVFVSRRFTACIHSRFMYSSQYIFTVVNEVRALQWGKLWNVGRILRTPI